MFLIPIFICNFAQWKHNKFKLTFVKMSVKGSCYTAMTIGLTSLNFSLTQRVNLQDKMFMQLQGVLKSIFLQLLSVTLQNF